MDPEKVDPSNSQRYAVGHNRWWGVVATSTIVKETTSVIAAPPKEKVPHAVGHMKRPASPFATHSVDVKDLGLDDAALDLDPQNLLGSGDELRDRCYLGPRHAVREHAPLNQRALHPGRHRRASHRAVCVYWYACDVCIRVCHEQKIGRLFSKFEIAAAGGAAAPRTGRVVARQGTDAARRPAAAWGVWPPRL